MWALPNKVIFCRSLMLIATSMSLQVLFLWYLIITSGLLAAISLSLCVFAYPKVIILVMMMMMMMMIIIIILIIPINVVTHNTNSQCWYFA